MPNPQQILGLILKSVGQGYSQGYLPIEEYNTEKAFRDKQYADVLKQRAWEQDQAKRQATAQGFMWTHEQAAKAAESEANRANALKIAKIPNSYMEWGTGEVEAGREEQYPPGSYKRKVLDALIEQMMAYNAYRQYQTGGKPFLTPTTRATYEGRAEQERKALLDPKIQEAGNILQADITKSGVPDIAAGLRALAKSKSMMAPYSPQYYASTIAPILKLATDIEHLASPQWLDSATSAKMRAGAEAAMPNRDWGYLTDSTKTPGPDVVFGGTTTTEGSSYRGPASSMTPDEQRAVADIRNALKNQDIADETAFWQSVAASYPGVRLDVIKKAIGR